MIGAREIGLMKPSAFLINIARGPVIDEDAVYAALRAGTIGGAALDVWWQYPNAAEPQRRGSRHPFHELPNVIVTPHNSGWTQGMVRRRRDEIADNIGRCVRGESLINDASALVIYRFAIAAVATGAFSLEGGSDGTAALPAPSLGATLATTDSLFHIADVDGTRKGAPVPGT